MNLGFLRRLVKEDFSDKDRALIEKIAVIFNPALESVVQALNRGMAISDLNVQVKDVDLTVGADGKPTQLTSFQSTLKGTCTMLLVARAQNLSNTTVYPTSAPFISFIQNGEQIVLQHISGLQAGAKYRLRIIALV